MTCLCVLSKYLIDRKYKTNIKMKLLFFFLNKNNKVLNINNIRVSSIR